MLAHSIAAASSPAGENRDPRRYFFVQTFGDLPEELEDASAQGKRGMLLFFEMEGCVYCRFMRRDIFSDPTVQEWFGKHFVSIAVDIKGDVEMTDFDGVTLPSKMLAAHREIFMSPVITLTDLQGNELFRRWGVVRTPAELLLIGKYIIDEQYDDIDFVSYARQHDVGIDSEVTGTALEE